MKPPNFFAWYCILRAHLSPHDVPVDSAGIMSGPLKHSYSAMCKTL